MVNTWKSISFLVTLALVLSLAVMALPVATPVLASPGADYYVATTGDDSRTATQAQNPATPWKTISHAVDTVPAGTSPDDPNVIHVADGTYDNTNNEESFPITLDSQNVTLLADSTAAIIDQEFLGTGTGTILKIEATGITIDGFTLDRAGYGIMAYVGGFNILDNIFSNNTDHDISYGVYVSITGNDRNIDFTFDDILIDGNDFYITSDGVYINIDLDFDHTKIGLSATSGDIDIFDNLFDMNTTDGVDIGFYVYDLTGGSVSIGDIDISGGNEFYAGYRGVDFYGDLEHFTDTTVTVGDLKVNGNYFEDQTNQAIYIDYYYCNDWDGTTTATFGDLEVNNNDIDSAELGCDGIYVNKYAYWECFYDDVTVTAGNIYIDDNNTIYVDGDGIYFRYYSTEYLYNNSSVTLGDLSIQGNNIDAGSRGIYLYYNDFGYYMYDSSQVTTGEVHIGGTGVNEGNTIDAGSEAIYIYYEYVAYEMGEDGTPSEDAALYMGDIYIQENFVSGQSDGVDIYYYEEEVGYEMYDDAYAELPSYVITGNNFNVTGDGICYYTYENPYYVYDSSTVDFGGLFIDDNTFNDETVGMDHGIYFDNEYFCYDTYDTSTTILGTVTITNNRFYDLGDDAIYIYYYELGTSMYDESMLEVEDIVIADNVIDGADYGIDIYYEVDAGAANIEIGILDITGNNISNVTYDGIYIYGDVNFRGPAQIYSPTHAWYSHDDYNAQDTTLTGTFDLTGTTSPELTFWHWYNTESACDGGRVEVDDGSGWTAITPDGGYPGHTSILGDCYEGESAGWEQATFNLSAYAGDTIDIIDMRFRYAGDSSVAYFGWLVDDISISEIGFFDDVESGVDGWTAASTEGSAWSIVTLEDLPSLVTTISENIINDSGRSGIYLEDYHAVSITGNTLQNSPDGIYLIDSDGNQILYNDIFSNPGPPPSGIHLDSNCEGNVIHFNNIVGNSSGDYGVYNANTGEIVDAEYNWWGSEYGPDDTPNDTVECLAPSEGGWNCDTCDKNAEPVGQLGDRVSDYVDYCPWLTEAYAPEKCVATFPGTGIACFTTSSAIEGLTAVDEGDLPDNGNKPDLYFPHGFFSFNIVGLSPGQTVIVTITLPSAVPIGTQYWKYHLSEGGWIQIPMGSDNGDNVITITLVDGGLGDDDGVCDGVIVDQGAPGFVPPPVAVGGEAYPVNKLAILAPWLGLAVLLIGVITWFTLRRRKACL